MNFQSVICTFSRILREKNTEAAGMDGAVPIPERKKTQQNAENSFRKKRKWHSTRLSSGKHFPYFGNTKIKTEKCTVSQKIM